MTLIQPQRHLFDIPDDIAYFNCAYYAPLLNESRDRLLSGVADKCHPWGVTPPDFFEDAERLRQLASAILGGDSDGYAIIPAASYGISTAARAIEPTLKKGDRVLMIDDEFPSNVYPWRRVAHETGAEIITVSTPSDGNWTRALLEQLTESIKVVTISSCHWTNGAMIDLVKVSKAAHDLGCILVIDATQTLGAVPFPIKDVKPDFLVAAGYKWLLGPYGFGLMYVSPAWRNARPLEESWLARENAEDFSGLTQYSDHYMAGSRKFDGGEKCTSTILPGAIAAMEQIKKWGVQDISESLAAINKQISVHLFQLGFTLPEDSQRCPHMFGAVLPPHYKGNLVAELRSRKIYISQRGNSLRFAPHLYVTNNDLGRLLGALTELMK